MKHQKDLNLVSKLKQTCPVFLPVPRPLKTCLLVLLAAAVRIVVASENVPHRPFGMWADLPEPRQFVLGVVYEESEAYHIWAGHEQHNITYPSKGQSYGIDINQGYLALQYGLTDRWAADFNIGGTTAGWRYFDNGRIRSTTGLMDYSFGVRYQIFNEAEAENPWIPTLTFRVGAVLPGSFNENFAYAPGTRSAAIEPGLLFRKQFGLPGFGAYGDAFFRWNRTTGNDLYITVIGLFQKIKNWELAAGYRHLQTVTGSDIRITNPDDPATVVLVYPRDVREINDSIEAGFSYTTPKRHIRLGFHSRTVFDGSNTDRKFWVGASIDFPIGGKTD